MNFDVFNGDARRNLRAAAITTYGPRVMRRSLRVSSVISPYSLEWRRSLETTSRCLIFLWQKNQQPLRRLLDSDVTVDYVDHHAPGDIPKHRGLTVTISEASEVCTALLMNGRLRGAQVAWAVVGAFGDNLDEPALKLGC